MTAPPTRPAAGQASHATAAAAAADPGLGPGRRLGLLSLGFLLLLAAGPGAIAKEGSALAFLGLVPWVLAASRPGRRAFRIEVLAGSLHGAATLYWIAHVWWPALIYAAIGWGVYLAGAGWALRRLARRLPLPLAAALAFGGMEALRALAPPPFGLRWLQLGHHAAFTPILAESARLWGPSGLTVVLAALAGFGARFLALRGRVRALGGGDWILGLGPLVLALAYALASSAPPSVPGPRLLLVQPAFPQWRKQAAGDVREKFLEQLELTREGLEATRRAGRPDPDLVCWGETMLYVTLVDPALVAMGEAELAGLEVYPWWKVAPAELPALVRGRLRHEELWVGEALFGLGRQPRLLPEGTWFLSGAEVLFPAQGRLEHQNAVALWDAGGARRGHAAKLNLVPGAETMLGLERLAGVRDFIWKVAGYVPDFSPAERTGVLELETRAGERHAFGATVCFDNAFPRPYAEPLRRGPLDFHLVVSNEAWYLDSFEMDQMMAFTRLLALATGRAVVRATNSGITVAFGPDGTELARLVRGGRDRHVPGTLEVQVPVPGRSGPGAAPAPRPPFVHLEPWIDPAWLALSVLFLLLPSRGARYRSVGRG